MIPQSPTSGPVQPRRSGLLPLLMLVLAAGWAGSCRSTGALTSVSAGPPGVSEAARAPELTESGSTQEPVELTGEPRQDGFPGATVGDLEALMRSSHAGDEPLALDALERWVELRAEQDTLNPEALDGLPSPEEWPHPAPAQVRAFLTNPGDARQDVSYWIDDHDPYRRFVLALALGQLARQAAREGDAPLARATFERGIEVARSAAPSNGHSPHPRLYELGIGMGLGQVALHHEHPELLEGTGVELPDLVREVLPDRRVFDSSGREQLSDAALLELHTVLGLLYADLERWRPGDWYAAPEHLRRAIAASPEPQPNLSRRLAEGLDRYGMPVGSLNAWRDAVAGYLELDAEEDARDAYRDAATTARGYRKELGKKLREIEDMVYPRHGWYLGVGLGWTDAHTSSAEVEADLLALGHSALVDLDQGRQALKAFVGYRFEGPFALEAGYTGSRGIDSRIEELGPANPTFAGDVARVHPLAGRALALSVIGIPYEGDDVLVFGRLGGWLWQADVDVDVVDAGTVVGSIGFDDDGFDLFYGAGVQYRIDHTWSLRLEWERYELGRDDTDFVTLGLLYQL